MKRIIMSYFSWNWVYLPQINNIFTNQLDPNNNRISLNTAEIASNQLIYQGKNSRFFGCFDYLPYGTLKNAYLGREN